MNSQEGNAGNTASIDHATERQGAGNPGGIFAPATVGNAGLTMSPRGRLQRGLSGQLSTEQLQVRSWTVALTLANRFRVIRTLDIAVAC